MGGFPLHFNSNEYTDLDFAENKNYKNVYPDLLSDVPPTFDLASTGTAGGWTDHYVGKIFPELTTLTLKVSRLKAFFPGQMLLFKNGTKKDTTGAFKTQFHLRVISYDSEIGTLIGKIEGVQAPSQETEWDITVAGSEIKYNGAKTLPFSQGATGAVATLAARNTLFADGLFQSMVEVFEDFTGFGDSVYWDEINSRSFCVTQSGGTVKLQDGNGPTATIGMTWLGVASLNLGTASDSVSGIMLRNNVLSDYFGIVNIESDKKLEMIARVYIPVLGTGGNDYKLSFGLFRTAASMLTDAGASGGFTYTYKNATNAGRWVARTGGSIVTTTNTVTAPVTGWVILRLLYDPATGDLTFYQNGALISTIAISGANNIFSPAGMNPFNNALIPGLILYSDTTNTTAKTFYLDYLFFRSQVLR